MSGASPSDKKRNPLGPTQPRRGAPPPAFRRDSSRSRRRASGARPESTRPPPGPRRDTPPPQQFNPPRLLDGEACRQRPGRKQQRLAARDVGKRTAGRESQRASCRRGDGSARAKHHHLRVTKLRDKAARRSGSAAPRPATRAATLRVKTSRHVHGFFYSVVVPSCLLEYYNVLSATQVSAWCALRTPARATAGTSPTN